jgi:serine-type D-Ala-D-Ala endopeptidase (penicillin-binding protein 7)
MKYSIDGFNKVFSCFDYSGFFVILAAHLTVWRSKMRSRYPIFLLFFMMLNVHAAGNEALAPVADEQVAEIQEEGRGLENMLQANEASAQSGEQQEASSEQMSDKSRKALDELLTVMPQLGYAADNAKAKEDAEDQQALDSMVLKFSKMPKMRSAIVMVYDEHGDKALYGKNTSQVAPIASITKLMTAMVVLDAKQPLDEEISILPEDINRQKRTRSRTRTGMTMTRGELLKLALMASDNLSAAALARTYPGGTEAALAEMNAKARELGMNSTRFLDPTGLNSGNVSTAQDLVKMVRAAKQYELIQRFTTSTTHTLELAGHRPVRFHNTNPLVRNTSWEIGLSKTGYISEAGRCLVMEAKITGHPVIMVLLDSWGRSSRVGDANRVRRWMENASLRGREARNL